MLAKAVDDRSSPPSAADTIAYIVDMLFELSRIGRQANDAELATVLTFMARMYRKRPPMPPSDA